MKQRFHMCQSVTGPLRNWSGRQWNDAIEWITRDDGSKFASGEELEHRFQELADKGVEVIPIGQECDNFDPKQGCLGHQIPDILPSP
jgi:hypothetical protein